ncbi:MAG: nucleotidyltransferase domain-containing protein [Caulobacter sp.]
MTADLRFADAVSADRRDQIARRLADIAREEGVRVLLAVESGSRAWGFHSPDSDYDVRFVYARPIADYLSLTPPRDVIERPIDDDLDIGGWDVAKALRLVARGNAVVSEWLSSPILYTEDADFRSVFEPIAQAWRDLHGDVAHYHGLARRQWGSFIEGREEVRLKKYFYVIRPAVALQWLRERGDAQPPMSLPRLLDHVRLPPETAEALEDLRRRKQAAGETVGVGARIPAIDAYVREQMAWAVGAKPSVAPRDPALWARTEAAFRALVGFEG